jgi:hypothetical protein
LRFITIDNLKICQFLNISPVILFLFMRIALGLTGILIGFISMFLFNLLAGFLKK